jgi:cyclophilin family peptidyl-prolyl cis-trans isomerase
MATGRNPKRARKKDRRAARREEYMREYLRRRRQRRFVLLGTLVVLLGVGAGAFFLLKPSKKHAAASPLPTPRAQQVACGGKIPAAASTKKKSYSSAPDQSLDPSTTYTWKLQTSCGEIDIALDVKDSPKTANSVVFLTRQGFYDGTFFHRIAPNFVIQGGDPGGTGTGGPGYKTVDPIPAGFKYVNGTVAMAKAGNEAAGTSGSQFFIVTSDTGGGGLTPDYAVLGHVTAGADVVQKIAATSTGQDGPPDPAKGKTYIEKATVVEG